MTHEPITNKPKPTLLGIDRTGWRYIGLALSILSLGLAIAWAGLVLFSK